MLISHLCTLSVVVEKQFAEQQRRNAHITPVLPVQPVVKHDGKCEIPETHIYIAIYGYDRQEPGDLELVKVFAGISTMAMLAEDNNEWLFTGYSVVFSLIYCVVNSLIHCVVYSLIYGLVYSLMHCVVYSLICCVIFCLVHCVVYSLIQYDVQLDSLCGVLFDILCGLQFEMLCVHSMMYSVGILFCCDEWTQCDVQCGHTVLLW